MAKKNLRTAPITKSDLEEYLKTESDFAFELCAIPLLSGLGFTVQHGGTYSDPITGINRQFDLRAESRWSPIPDPERTPRYSHSLRLAVECKNLSPNFPLLVSCVPRSEAEAYNSLVLSDGQGRAGTARLRGRGSEYEIGTSVGKATDQIGRSDPKGDFVTGDSEVYEKWAQAIASSADLISQAAADQPDEDSDVHCSSIVPVLLVPDNTLWSCRYEGGVLVDGPVPTDRVSVFIGKEWPMQGRSSPYAISHLEILTVSGFTHHLPKMSIINTGSYFDEACGDAAKRWLDEAVPSVEVVVG